MTRKRYAVPGFDKRYNGKTYTRVGGIFTTRVEARAEANRLRKYGQLARVFKRDRGEYYVYVWGKARRPRADE
jgi:hypothetical protein